MFSTYFEAADCRVACYTCGKYKQSVVSVMPADGRLYYTLERCTFASCELHCHGHGEDHSGMAVHSNVHAYSS